MEILPARKNPKVKISQELRENLLEFTLKSLLDQPHDIHPYAKEYFIDLCNGHTKITYDICADEPFMSSSSEEEIFGSDESDEGQQDFHIPDDLPDDYTRGGRSKVVYSEAYNPEKDTDDDEEDVIYEKTDEQKEMLSNVVTKCLLFRALDHEQVMRVVNVMFPKEVQPGDLVIQQFDDGDNFYIIEYGLYDVWMAEDCDSEPKHLFTYENSGNFGELALMYNMPRAATIKATTEGRLWAMDRNTFRKIVLKAAFRKRKMYEDLIAKVNILKELTPYEKMSLADALIPKQFSAGDVIMKEGDVADGMYFIEKGSVGCYLYDEESDEQIELSKISEGRYFGELALITHKPRAATVIALEDVKLAFLDVEVFERVLGPCLDIMARNVEQYQKVLNTRRKSLAVVI